VLAAGFSPWLVARRLEADEPELIVRNRRPLDLETPVEALDSKLTLNELFFVRSHFGAPAIAATGWTFEIGGMVERPLRLDLHGLRAFKPATVAAVLQCAGNGRSFFRPRIPGVGWERGGVGNAEWSGVRLADVLARAGVKKGAAHVQVLGADIPPAPKTPPFFRSIPLERALHPATLLATTMNEAPLPGVHGGPVRLVVPGWGGNAWTKWVRSITVAAEEAQGFYMQTGYRLPRTPAPPDAVLSPSDLVPVTTMNVKSLITRPAAGAKVATGRLEVRGIAWTGGDAVVDKVEVSVSIDDGPRWRPAELLDEARPWSWRRWRIFWEPVAARPGRVVIAARASDSSGATQPETTPWNKSGYLWNGIDRVSCEIG
jgi:DMSO/TMAO reductase YedYZ molybdopterin-dependent catalytic subunit